MKLNLSNKFQRSNITVIIIASVDCQYVLDTLTVKTHLFSTVKLTNEAKFSHTVVSDPLRPHGL